MVFDVEFIRGRGEPSGAATFKFYELVSGNPADFVRKAGDTMEGTLKIQGYTDDNIPLFKFALHPAKASNSDVMMVYDTNGAAKFYVTNEGDINASSTYTPKNSKHLTTKKYVDDFIKEYASPKVGVPGRTFKWSSTGQGRYCTSGKITADIVKDEWQNLMYVSQKDMTGQECYHETSNAFRYSGILTISKANGKVVVLAEFDQIANGVKSKDNHIFWDFPLTTYRIKNWIRRYKSQIETNELLYVSDGFMI